MKIITVVGARPQFIKAAIGSREIRKKHQEILVHTGQHYDNNMSAVFFSELSIPTPDYHLGIAGGSHGQMTGQMLMELEKVFISEQPDMALVYGDTNSTLAGGLAAVKLHIPVAHVEAGNRFHTLESPEEVNRIVTDHISTLRFACTQSAYQSLALEGLAQNSFLSGDLMYDAFLYYRKLAERQAPTMTDLYGKKIETPARFYYMTCHRQENTQNTAALTEILTAVNSLDAPTVYPVHPRNQHAVKDLLAKRTFDHVLFVEPVGYLESLYLLDHAEKIVTDSGGLQREAFFAGKPCVTVLDFVVWPETMVGNRNQLSRPVKDDILKKLCQVQEIDPLYQPFGDGHAAERIIGTIDAWAAGKSVG